jgi:hypothetical protein
VSRRLLLRDAEEVEVGDIVYGVLHCSVTGPETVEGVCTERLGGVVLKVVLEVSVPGCPGTIRWPLCPDTQLIIAR